MSNKAKPAGRKAAPSKTPEQIAAGKLRREAGEHSRKAEALRLAAAALDPPKPRKPSKSKK